jgi:YD repeat-containing protein
LHADGTARSFERDPWGRVTLAVLEGGARVRTEWGALDRVLGEDIEGDPGDGGPERLLARTRLATTSAAASSAAQCTPSPTTPTPPQLLTSTRWYDADGVCVRRQEPTGESWLLEHDGLMRLRVTEDPLGNRHRVDFGVDGLPELITEEDQGPDGPRSRSTEARHDARGRLIEHAAALGRPAWLPVGRPRPHGRADRPARRPHPPRLRPARRADARAHRPRRPRPRHTKTSTSPVARASRRTRPARRRSSSTTCSAACAPLTLPDGGQVIYHHDAKGRLAKITRPDGAELTHTFDAAGRLAALEAKPGPGCTPVPKHSYKYDASAGSCKRARATRSSPAASTASAACAATRSPAAPSRPTSTT